MLTLGVAVGTSIPKSMSPKPHKSRITLRSPILYSPKGKQYPSPNAVSPHPRAAAGAGDGENNSSLAAAAVPLRIRPPPRHQHRPMEAATVAGEGESQRNWDRGTMNTNADTSPHWHNRMVQHQQ
uniref:Uncharacterized protein n=1 Tax=Oryza nivara TaxID=4536 RepID=A0A0E0I5S5_ORYNI